MVRPYKKRGVKEPPKVRSFKPAGIPLRYLETVTLTVDEFEAVRLADYEGLGHKDSADRMGISRPTFSRVIERARRKLGEALFEVKEIFIEGGNVYFRNNLFRCQSCRTLIRVDADRGVLQECSQCGSMDVTDLGQTFGCGKKPGKKKRSCRYSGGERK